MNKWYLFVNYSCLLAAFAHLSIIFTAFKPAFSTNVTCKDTDLNVTFDKSLFTNTIVTEFRLVCDRAVYLPLLTFTYMSAIAVTNLFVGKPKQSLIHEHVPGTILKLLIKSKFLGILSDTFGRKEGPGC